MSGRAVAENLSARARMFVLLIYFLLLVNNLPAFLCIVARMRYVPQFLCGSMCMESKFHNGILQVREPSLLQASDGMLVSGYAGKSRVQNRTIIVFLVVKPQPP